MNRPDFMGGVCLAAGLAVLASVLAPFTPGVTLGTALHPLIPLLGLVYVVYLLSRATERVGQVTTAVFWVALAAGAWLAPLPLSAYVLLHVCAIWLIRSLYFHSSLLGAILDLGVCLFGIAGAGWAFLYSGSVFLAVWSFFLSQAAFALIPVNLISEPGRSVVQPTPSAQFQRARGRADAALRRLCTQSDSTC